MIKEFKSKNSDVCKNRYAGKRRTVGNRYAGTKRCVVKKPLMSKTGSNRINLKVGKSQKQFLLPSILPKNEWKKLLNSAIAFNMYWQADSYIFRNVKFSISILCGLLRTTTHQNLPQRTIDHIKLKLKISHF